MKFCVLGPREGELGYTTKKIMEEAKKDFKVELVPIIDVKLQVKDGIDALYGKKSLKEYDYVFPRIDSKRAQIGYPVMRFLDFLKVKKPYVAETVIIAHNKFITLEQLAKNNVPVPETYLASSKESSNEIMEKLKPPRVIKLLSGFGGEGVMMIDSKEAFKSIVETMKTLKQELLIESYVPNPGEDIRGIMAGEEIIGSYKRVAPPGERKANIHLGGKGKPFKLTPEMEEIVFKSGDAVKSRLCAVDMVQGKEGVKVIEVNINFGIRGIEKTTNLNIAKRIVDFVKEEIKR